MKIYNKNPLHIDGFFMEEDIEKLYEFLKSYTEENPGAISWTLVQTDGNGTSITQDDKRWLHHQLSKLNLTSDDYNHFFNQFELAILSGKYTHDKQTGQKMTNRQIITKLINTLKKIGKEKWINF